MSDKPTLDDMLWALHDEADRIEVNQRALVKSGARTAEDPAQLRRAHIFRAAAELVLYVGDHEATIKAAIAGKRGRAA